MHWLASVGTQYRLKKMDASPMNSISRALTVIIVLILVSQLNLVHRFF
jgi:hypothetical protein